MTMDMVEPVETGQTHTTPSHEETVQAQVDTLRAIGFGFGPHRRVLDFGCGDCWLVRSFRQRGVQAYGCDIKLPDTDSCRELQEHGIVMRMDGEPPRAPFPEGMFDLVTSNMVLEHVSDLSTACAELHRLLKPGGLMMHVFASRYSLLEPHCYVPLASVIRPYWWLYLWAVLGVRGDFQKGLSATATARHNQRFLRTTQYPTQGRIKRIVGQYFEDVAFREDVYLRFTPRGRRLPPVLHSWPVAALYRATRARVLVARKPSLSLANRTIA
jgi:SAM-dependent methyltransferase